MEYRPRMDSTDVELDSDDRWLSRRGLGDRVDEILGDHDYVTVGIAEQPLQLDRGDIDRRIQRLEPRLRQLGRMHTLEDGVVFHWTVAGLVAHQYLHEWWAVILPWPLGWWLNEHAEPPPPIPGDSQ
jgi:hypothetical protein